MNNYLIVLNLASSRIDSLSYCTLQQIAEDWSIEDNWVIFTDTNGNEVLGIPASNIQYIKLTDAALTTKV
jgi:hypothetical protein